MSEEEEPVSQEDAEDAVSGGNWKSDDFVAFGHEEVEGYNEDEAQGPTSSKRIVLEDDLPPWMTSAPRQGGARRVNPLVALHNEIVEFCELMAPMPEEIREREVLVDRFKKVANLAFGASKVCFL